MVMKESSYIFTSHQRHSSGKHFCGTPIRMTKGKSSGRRQREQSAGEKISTKSRNTEQTGLTHLPALPLMNADRCVQDESCSIAASLQKTLPQQNLWVESGSGRCPKL